MSYTRRIPMSRAGVKSLCVRAFIRGMEAQAEKTGTPQGMFDAWWASVVGPDPKTAKARLHK